jgi:hyperosmotically inducible periplasmic protein
MLKRTGIAIGFIASVLVAGIGCAGSPSQRTAGETVDDAGLAAKVKTALVQDPVTKARDINVKVYQGQVQLAGFVDSANEKMQAGKVVQSVAGVTAVRNDLEVKAGDRTAGQAIDDGVITTKVKAALIKDSRTKAYQIDVNTNQGVVQLAGFVDDTMAKTAAAELAQSVSGVRSVRNDLEVKN